MSVDYRLILKAQLDTKGIDATLASYNDKKINLRINVDGSQVDALKQRFEQIKREVEGSGVRIKYFGDSEGNLNKAMLSYSDGIGKAKTEMWALNSATGKWKMIGVTAAEDVAKAERLANQELERNAKLLESATLYADKFAERAKNLQQTPQVQQGLALSQQINQAALQGDVEGVKTLRRELEVLDAGIRQSGHSAWSFGEQLKVAFQRLIEYSIGMMAINESMRQFREGIKYISDLNKEMTNIQLVTGQSDLAVGKLATQYNNMAKEMGVTTLEVTKGSLEFIRQGKSVEETTKLLTSSIQLSKLANMDSAQSTEYLTAIMNGFKFSAQDMVGVVDRLVAVDNIAATSSAELATALQYSAFAAQAAGVDFDHLNAYVGTVSAQTRLSAETIGQAFPVFG